MSWTRTKSQHQNIQGADSKSVPFFLIALLQRQSSPRPGYGALSTVFCNWAIFMKGNVMTVRASELTLLAKCRGYGSISAPYQLGSEFAVAGTAFHELARAKVLGEDIPFDNVRLKYGLSEDDFNEVCRALFNIQISIPSGAKVFADDDRLESELGFTGQPDFGLFNDRRITIIDWKSGWADVEHPRNNHQIIGYAILVLENIKRLFDVEVEDIDEVDVMIILPKKNIIKAHRFNIDDFDDLRNVVKTIIEESKEKDPEFNIGSHCQKCYKCMQCKAFSYEFMKMDSIIYKDGQQVREKALSRMVPLVKSAMVIHNKVMAAAKKWVDDNGDLDLGGGMILSKTEGEIDEIDLTASYKTLSEFFGDELMELLKVTKTSLKQASKEKPRGFYKEVYDALAECGGIVKVKRTKYEIMGGQ